MLALVAYVASNIFPLPVPDPPPVHTPAAQVTLDGTAYVLNAEAWVDEMPQVGQPAERSVMLRFNVSDPRHPGGPLSLPVQYDSVEVRYGGRTWTGKPVEPGLVHTQGLPYVANEKLQLTVTFSYGGRTHRLRLAQPVPVGTVS